MNAKLIGRAGEAAAAEYLRKKGYDILACGYHSRYGEIDIIAFKRGITAIIEVKTRTNSNFAEAMEFVDSRKQQKIKLTTQQWLVASGEDLQIRFDVIEVYPNNVINHLENAFQ